MNSNRPSVVNNFGLKLRSQGSVEPCTDPSGTQLQNRTASWDKVIFKDEVDTHHVGVVTGSECEGTGTVLWLVTCDSDPTVTWSLGAEGVLEAKQMADPQIGTSVRKWFGGSANQYYHGEVESYRLAGGRSTPLWRISYEDGDREDVEYEEFEQIKRTFQEWGQGSDGGWSRAACQEEAGW